MRKRKIRFEHNGKRYKMTPDQIEAAFRYQDHQYRLSDAKSQFTRFVFGDSPSTDGSDDAELEFEKRFDFAFTFEEAFQFVEDFAEEFEWNYDCNESENTQWENAISNVLYVKSKMINEERD